MSPGRRIDIKKIRRSFDMIITTERLVLRPWRDTDFDVFAAMVTDPQVMVDTPALTGREECEAKFRGYQQAYDDLGHCRWLAEEPDGTFVGYAGVMPIPPTLPVAPGVQVGWRLIRRAWGRGYATEAARASLKDGFERCGFSEVLSYTAPDNLRSQAVMARLGLERQPWRDFVDEELLSRPWTGLVWRATPTT